MGFFENGTVVCDGYAKTFQWMLNYLGIDSYELIGKANGEIHAWNKVLLDGVSKAHSVPPRGNYAPKRGPRRSPMQWVRRGKEEQRNERDLPLAAGRAI